jgi:hypothetical protein
MIIHREIRSSYHHKPIAQGVDYSLFIMVMMVEMLEKVEIPPPAPPAEFPPPIFDGTASILVFWCFGGALCEESLGGSFYRGF